ncbi:MAG: class I SAM-dependent methyltransferase [Lachnospiraceae bacterium]|jgi:SAM-dependent methyltransferase|nr:class I SAM-dependent methyltransferase [Lachnospiraceae bacterium]
MEKDNDMYRSFAGVYDQLMADVPYDEWSRRLDDWIGQYGISQKGRSSEADLVVDLGCGTGTLTGLLARMGYECIGIDNSQEMLTVARKKVVDAPPPILYLCQDMREMELYGTVGTVVSVCDCLNYLLTEEDLLAVFSRVNNYLYPGGIFIFDFNTIYKYETVIGDTTIAENREECSFIWENYYHDEEGINEYDVSFFVREQDGRYRRFQENHYQKGYSLETVRGLLERAGMRFIAAFDGESGGAVSDESERIYVIAGEAGKQ